MKYIGEDNDGNSIKCDPESEEFEERYKNAVEFAKKKHLDGEKLKYPAKKKANKKKNALRNPKKKTLEKNEKSL